FDPPSRSLPRQRTPVLLSRWVVVYAPCLAFLNRDVIHSSKALSPREPYSSLQTSRRYLRIRHGNKAEPAVRKSELKRLPLRAWIRNRGLPVERLYPISRPSTSHRTGSAIL